MVLPAAMQAVRTEEKRTALVTRCPAFGQHALHHGLTNPGS